MDDELKPNPPRKMPHPILFLAGLLLVLSLACNMPVIADQAGQDDQPGFVETGIAQTMAALEEGQPGAEATAQETLEPEISETPTLTPTVTDTPTPEVALVYVSENTNCRAGQGTVFQWLVSLQAGDEAEAVGVDTPGDYWYIRRPDQPSSYCWLWGKYATPSGPYQSLPVYTPMPTPTQGFDFKVTYHSKITCFPSVGLQYRIDNIGAFTLESFQTSATDHTGGSGPITGHSDEFLEYSPSCAFINNQHDLAPGESFYVLMGFSGDPTGHDISTKIKICTKDGLAGECLTKTIRHTP